MEHERLFPAVLPDRTNEFGRNVSGVLDYPIDLGPLYILLLGRIIVFQFNDLRLHDDRANRNSLVADELEPYLIDEPVVALIGEIDQPVLHLMTKIGREIAEENHIVGMQVHDVVVGNHDPVDRRYLVALHGTFQPPADFGWLNRTAEDAPDGAFHQAFDKSFKSIQAVDHRVCRPVIAQASGPAEL
jgi:hypothetical protein